MTLFIEDAMTPEDRSKTVSRLLADDYSQKILAYTYESPVSAQRLSKVCRIPIAACYRRIHELEQVGLISVDREKEVYKGRRVRLYRCKLKSAVIRFSNGRFVLKYDVLPDNGNGGDEHASDPHAIAGSSA
ncbi:MAG: helix-turn-helix domain-containing protein [Thermoplasmata archaeon]|nr:helix-turn-helix domain-containing protein [Thermoplasmata archaeon]